MQHGEKFPVEIVLEVFNLNGTMEYLDTDPAGDNPVKLRFYGANQRLIRVDQATLDKMETLLEEQ